MTLTIDMLPARQGDALWIEWGTPRRRLLFDAGVASAWKRLKPRIQALPESDRHFELLVISHVDNDHIAGSLPLLEEAKGLGVSFGDVWFNGYRHLPDTPIESFGPIEGERLTKLLAAGDSAWNEAFEGGPVEVAPDGALPRRELGGGLFLTLLSPGRAQLAALEPVWKKVVQEAGLDPTVAPEPPALPPGVERLGARPNVKQLAASRFSSDTAEANGSSIAVLLEFEGRSTILAADAFPGVVTQSVRRLLEERNLERLALDAFKLPHHGSRANINVELLELLDCPLHLFSTDGTQTRHPHLESVARVLHSNDPPVALAFNYCSEYNEPWRDPATVAHYGYRVDHPDEGTEGLAIDL